MKKLVLGMALVGSILGATTSAVSAATTTNGDVTFKPGTVTVDPDPSNPDPSNPNANATAADLNFGLNEITDKDVTLNNTYAAAHINVNDLTGTTTSTWNLTVAQDAQFKSVKDAKELTNAALTLNAAKDTTASTSGAVDVTASSVLVPGADKKPAAPVNVVGAKDGNGNGKTQATIAGSTLAVPGATVKVSDNYKTTLTWDLADVVA
ncbi:WxL domain-containing protein [Dellaglioa sp. P0083]|uniref:WxL domain-containing protein n=1 Tax=Dellaglioa kimchii TaxID=3344667 RepID=UPI0038D48681